MPIAKYTKMIPPKFTQCNVYYIDPTFVKPYIKHDGTLVLGYIRKPRTKCK